MNEFAVNLINAFGGSTAVARLMFLGVSTVHSWKSDGIPESRKAHLQLIAERDDIPIDWATGLRIEREDESPDDRLSVGNSAASTDCAAEAA